MFGDTFVSETKSVASHATEWKDWHERAFWNSFAEVEENKRPLMAGFNPSENVFVGQFSARYKSENSTSLRNPHPKLLVTWILHLEVRKLKHRWKLGRAGGTTRKQTALRTSFIYSQTIPGSKIWGRIGCYVGWPGAFEIVHKCLGIVILC